MRIPRLKLSRFSFLVLLVTICSLALLSMTIIRGMASANSSRDQQHQQSAVGPERISALGERPAWLNLVEGRKLPSDYNAQTSNGSMLRDGNARALSLASGDFDEDGTADLVCGYRVAGKGLVTIHRGNPDAISANTPVSNSINLDSPAWRSGISGKGVLFGASPLLHSKNNWNRLALQGVLPEPETLRLDFELYSSKYAACLFLTLTKVTSG
jgi:hypothetical protein